MTVVPAPARADDAQAALQRLHPIGQPAQPRAAGVVGAADAVVGDLDARHSVERQTRIVTLVACAYLATFASASEATK